VITVARAAYPGVECIRTFSLAGLCYRNQYASCFNQMGTHDDLGLGTSLTAGHVVETTQGSVQVSTDKGEFGAEDYDVRIVHVARGKSGPDWD